MLTEMRALEAWEEGGTTPHVRLNPRLSTLIHSCFLEVGEVVRERSSYGTGNNVRDTILEELEDFLDPLYGNW